MVNHSRCNHTTAATATAVAHAAAIDTTPAASAACSAVSATPAASSASDAVRATRAPSVDPFAGLMDRSAVLPRNALRLHIS